jgi:hypothetical protein
VGQNTAALHAAIRIRPRSAFARDPYSLAIRICPRAGSTTAAGNGADETT